jgi:hypothetical protein
LILGAIVLSMLAGCTAPPEPPSPSISTTDDLLAALRDAGPEVEETALLASMGELGAGRVYFMDGARLEVFEYDTVAARESAASRWLLQEPDFATASGVVVWGHGQLIVAYRGSEGGVIALLSGLLGDPLTLPNDVVDEPYPPAVVAAIAFLAEDLDEDPGSIVVVGFEATEWPDACLGLAGPDEACAQGLTPGWRVELRADGTSHVVRTDQVGATIRGE